MGDKPVVALRYCGGCNPRYDRTGAADQLKRSLPHLDFAPLQSEGSCLAALIICGCTSRCANVDKLALPKDRLVYLVSPVDIPQARAQLIRLFPFPAEQDLPSQQPGSRCPGVKTKRK